MKPKTDKKTAFKDRVIDWAEKLDVKTASIVIRPMKTKWASCSTSGRLTFDEALLKLSHKIQDYVVVHELLHFRTPNHGKLWKSLMKAYLGDYESSADKLKQIADKIK